MEIIKAHLKNGQYKDKETPKSLITLHHTAGTTASGALDWWDQTPARVGCAYVVDQDGKIYEAFDPKYWAWHINIPNDGDFFEKANIGIELVNPGFVFPRKDGNFNFYPMYPNTNYHTVIPKEKVVECEFRGFKYFQKYSEAQLDSLSWLLDKLIKDFKIPMQEPKLFDHFWEHNKIAIDLKLPGIWSHSTFRSDKSDIFPYEPLISMVSEVYNQNIVKVPEVKPYSEKVIPTSVKVDKAPNKNYKRP